MREQKQQGRERAVDRPRELEEEERAVARLQEPPKEGPIVAGLRGLVEEEPFGARLQEPVVSAPVQEQKQQEEPTEEQATLCPGPQLAVAPPEEERQ
mmetsp:Transcript_32375/g.70069  ORF Transcript_32375/g.70069 Transcript_32375/m.70069 type:complete len:97 (-) Transcript_32375:3891-4181(-)